MPVYVLNNFAGGEPPHEVLYKQFLPFDISGRNKSTIKALSTKALNVTQILHIFQAAEREMYTKVILKINYIRLNLWIEYFLFFFSFFFAAL